ncbi:MAG: CYTH domain-containing protein, partial [Lysinibacillus sp.]|nr:CYTH domain-containing protein [Lysinibacillus sp.]
EEQRDAILAGNDFEAPSVKERLLQLNVPIKDLRAFGSITTDRIEIPYAGGTLVLDRSFYLHQEDYEVEYETNDVEVGNKEFLQFLQQRNIDFLPADNKIARFMKALMDGGK